MKKFLFASTAAVALTVAGAAQAQVELGLGGYWEEWVGFVDQDEDEEDWDQQSDKEIHIKGSTTLDNGITVGVRFEIEAQDIDTGNKHDESVLSISGGFGTLLLGNEDNGANLLHVSAPDVGVGLSGGVVGGKWVAASVAGDDNNAFGTTAIYDRDDTNKVTYVTPTFGGFVAGASFIPDVAGSQSTNNVPTDAAGVPAYGVGAQYAGDFNDYSIKLSAGYAWADDTGIAGNDVEVDVFSLGGQVGFGGFTVGGSYINGDIDIDGAATAAISSTGFRNGDAWEVAASYGQGPWVASLGYFDGENDVDQSERQVVQASFSYNLGPGVDWKSSIASADFTDKDGDENDGWAVVTGFRLGF